MPAASPYDLRLMAKVDRRSDDECWPWLAAKHPSGHGRFKGPDGRPESAHLSVYRHLVGEIPEATELDHLCHTRDTSCAGGPTCPHRACVNPAHMEPVTKRDNLLRGRSFSADNARKTHCPKGHPLAGDNLVRSQLPWRACKTCKYAANAARAKRRAESP